jgi:TonB-linked SusC/RagA family outer membrane protein
MKKNLYLIIVLFAISSACFSQINGIVTDDKGLPLPGVNISAGNINAATDFEGNFTIDAAPGTSMVFTMIGFKTMTATATEGMKVVMTEDINTLNEVIVIGYGTKKAGSITGSVVQIKSAEIVKTPSQSAIQAIQGRAAGINIVASDEPGAQPTIRIRGIGTIIGGRDPLYVVDGVESGSLPSPNEIATIDILKDASSLAIYGQKGSNGVVIVSTKKGKPGKLVVNYDTYYGQKFIQHKVEMADSFRFAYYNNYVQGSTTYFNQEQPYNTDWFDEITGVGEVQSHYVSMAGGSENANYYFGVTNYKEKGILNGTEYERTNLNSRNEFRILGDRLKINPNMNVEIVKATDKPNGAFTTAYKQSPIVPVRFDNGRWGVPLRNPGTGLIDINGSDRFNNVGNPVSDLYYTNSQSRSLRLSGSITAELKLTDWLKFISNFGASYFVGKSFNYSPNADLWLSQNPTQDLADYEGTFGTNEVIYNTLTQNRNDEYLWNWDNYFTLHKTFGKHDLTGTLGMSRTTKNDNESLSGTRRNVPAGSNYWYLDLSSYNTDSAPGDVVRNSHVTPVVSIAYFARAEYEYDSRYLLTAVVRREGTSAFQSNKQWQIFPSVSAGWIISNESFMKDSKLFDFLKLRGGYGEVGNGYTQNSTNNVVFSSGYNYAFGANQNIFPGSVQPYQVDPNLTWETMAEVDFGLDFKILDNRMSGTLDLYNRKSKRLIVPIDTDDVLSPDRVTVNAGEVVNKGVEVSLRWDGKINDRLTYWISGNYSYNENELVDVSNSQFANYIGGSLGNGAYTKQVLVGQPLGSFYVFQVTGFDSSGNFTYSTERIAAGSYIPKYTYGLSLGVNYRNFDISADLYGVGGNKVYNGKKAQRFGGENIENDYLNSFWTPSTPNAENPTPYNGIPIASTYFIEDGSYLRINNITVGYTIPKLIKQVDKLRIYVTAINPFVFTKYTGYSPEVLNDGDPLGSAGIELDAYPTNKTFLVGLNVSF